MPHHGGDSPRPTGLSRRSFMQKAGCSFAGAGALATSQATGVAAARTLSDAAARDVAGNFGRMFPALAPFARNGEAVWRALIDFGRPGGPLDAKDDLSAGPVQLIVDPALSVDNPDNPLQPAGITFLGQFIDHDLTFDASSRLGIPTEPSGSPNQRKAFLDLDSVYGSGPTASPNLYERDRTRLRIESGGQFEDLPRAGDLRAIIGDPRNDEHLMVAGLHAAFIKFHNAVVDHVRMRGGTRRNEVFGVARREVRRHYQWIVLHEFLPAIVGRALVDEVLRNGRRYFRPTGPTVMPVEFQGAAFRFGHSQVRPSYRANLAGDGGEPFFGMIFDWDNADEGEPDPADLRGGARAPRRFIGWQTFFDFGDGEVKRNKRIDTHLSTPLFNLPLGAIATGQPPHSLATRNLLRQITWLLPSGQDIARTMRVPSLAPEDLAELTPYGIGLERRTPLWYYVLKEAEVVSDGLTLGPVGGRIVAEVLIGLLQRDPGSILGRAGWTPTLPSRDGRVTGDFRMVDLLTFAGVDPASRGQ